ncbi:DUF6197 family protein [Streptomyces griseus]|uniref:DUF6197 family protein n=1 Tax=Streptomyces griseus TaxID=1911 RepID=UPI0033D4824A
MSTEEFEAAARERLAAAAEHLSTHGWHQGDIYAPGEDDQYPATMKQYDEWTKTARSCALGAIQACGERSYHLESTAANLLREHLGLGFGRGLGEDGNSMIFQDPIAVWNDDPSRTAEDVILAMKGAANG